MPLPALSDFCWPMDPAGFRGADAVDDHGNPRYTDDDKARAAAFAGQSLRLLTGFRVGGCPLTVRPCRASHRFSTAFRYAGVSTPWLPVNLGGTWLNIGCGCVDDCGCAGLSEVHLFGPAYDVLKVKVDGVVLPPSAYRLDPGGHLIRTDGALWPLGQHLAAWDTEPGTWSVTYTPGVPVDGQGAYACGLLAAEYLKAMGDDDACALPTTVSQIVRQGVTLTLTPGAFPDGLTGIRLVDAYIQRWNPGRLRAAPVVWSPDLHPPRAVRRRQ